MIKRNALLSRISACVVIFVLISTLIALPPSESTNLVNMNTIKNVIEYENFESYPLGAFNGGGKWHLYHISEPYYPSRQMIVDKAHVSPSKALYLESGGDEDTIAGVMARITFNSSASVIGYQVFVMPVNEHIINIEFASEFKSIGNEFDNCYPYGTVEFSGGRIYVWSWDEDAGEYKRLFLKNYSLGKWYNVTVIYFKPIMTFYLWINNELQGTYRDPLLFRTGNIDSLLLECLFGGRAYFDDVVIFSNTPESMRKETTSSILSTKSTRAEPSKIRDIVLNVLRSAAEAHFDLQKGKLELEKQIAERMAAEGIIGGKTVLEGGQMIKVPSGSSIAPVFTISTPAVELAFLTGTVMTVGFIKLGIGTSAVLVSPEGNEYELSKIPGTNVYATSIVDPPVGDWKLLIELNGSGSEVRIQPFVVLTGNESIINSTKISFTQTEILSSEKTSESETETTTTSNYVDSQRKTYEVKILALIILVMAVVISVIVMIVLYLRRKTRDLAAEEIDWGTGIDWNYAS